MSIKTKAIIIVPFLAIMLGVSACASSVTDCDAANNDCAADDNSYGEMSGTIGGMFLGAYLGSKVGSGNGQSLSKAFGAIFGTIAGRELGRSFDRGNFNQAEEVVQVSMNSNPNGETSLWNNPDSGSSGSITPQTTYQNSTGSKCRDFESTITKDGKTNISHGQACLQPDGSWQVVE